MKISHNNLPDLLNSIICILNDKKINQANIEAKIILSEVLYNDNYNSISDIDFNKLNFIIDNRLKGKPLAKIINKKGFWNDIFYTNQHTLDPRADSEILIESIIEDFNDTKNDKINFIDLCSGTGCLGISLLGELLNAECLFLDISKAALKVNRINCNNLKVSNRSNFLLSDLFKNFKYNINNYKFIVCNPPYINKLDISKLNVETSHDPIIALEGGEKGYEYYSLIIEQLLKLGYMNSIYMEFDEKISENVCKLALDNNLKILYIKRDYLKLDRLIKISFQ